VLVRCETLHPPASPPRASSVHRALGEKVSSARQEEISVLHLPDVWTQPGQPLSSLTGQQVRSGPLPPALRPDHPNQISTASAVSRCKEPNHPAAPQECNPYFSKNELAFPQKRRSATEPVAFYSSRHLKQSAPIRVVGLPIPLLDKLKHRS
jgi:hypothetical protein